MRSAEPGEPNKLLFVAKLDRPILSFGILKKIIRIKKRLIMNPNSFNIFSNFQKFEVTKLKCINLNF